MSVYPFYIEANASGRRTLIAGGTRQKDGEITTTVYQRSEGSITSPFKIRQYSIYPIIDGVEVHQLVTDVYYKGEVIKQHVTNY